MVNVSLPQEPKTKTFEYYIVSEVNLWEVTKKQFSFVKGKSIKVKSFIQSEVLS